MFDEKPLTINYLQEIVNNDKNWNLKPFSGCFITTKTYHHLSSNKDSFLKNFLCPAQNKQFSKKISAYKYKTFIKK